MKIAVILLGAGAPIPWEGPFTWQITEQLFVEKEYLTKSKQNLAEYVRDKLAEFYQCDKSKIHFEYIINALETISDYHSELIQRGTPPQFSGSKPTWFDLNKAYPEVENFKFEPIDRDGGDTGFLFNLAKSGDSPTQLEGKNAARYYVLRAIECYLSTIRRMIRYDNKEILAKHKETTDRFYAFYKSLKDQGYAVRFYTTNYDELGNKILEQNGKSLFHGFEKNKNGEYFPNVERILNDAGTDTYYNLHGSIYWETGTNERIEPDFKYTPGFPPIHPQVHADYTNPSERTFIYNIITGFNKLQKVSIEPLKAFFTRLSMDSVNADLLCTIGYSYGDMHINRALGYGVQTKGTKFLHVTKSDNFFGEPEYINMQRHTIFKKHHGDFVADGNWKTYKDGGTIIYTGGFGDFLKEEGWKRI
jgi:hypothetical protein